MLDASSLSRALAQLEASLRYLRSDASGADLELRKQFRAACIQAFEFTYELAIRMIRRQLMEIVANPGALRELAFMDLMRTAAEAGLVRDAPPFRLYRERRNITSHSYNEQTAEQVLAGIDDFVVDVRYLLAALERRRP